MSEIADRHRRLAANFTATVLAVPDEAWDNPSPCESWTARDIIEHLAEVTRTYFQLTGEQPPQIPSADENPKGTWVATRDTVQRALDDPEVAAVEYDGPLGRTTLEDAINTLYCFDLLVHAWDLARATGGDERLDPAEVHHTFEAFKPMDEMLRTPGVCGPKIEPPDGADEQTQFLAFLGRPV